MKCDRALCVECGDMFNARDMREYANYGTLCYPCWRIYATEQQLERLRRERQLYIAEKLWKAGKAW